MNLDHVSNDQLLERIRGFRSDEADATANVVLYLGEVEARGLHAHFACGTLHEFCVQKLGYTEDEAYNRLVAARLGRRFPLVIDLLRSGELSLTHLRLLQRHLTAENHEALLRGACGKTNRELKLMLVCLYPEEPTLDRVSEERPTLLRPIAPGMFRVEMTVTREEYELLMEARALSPYDRRELRHVVGAGAKLLVEKLKKDRFGVGAAPREVGPVAETDRRVSRHVPLAQRREVYERDGGRCTFVDEAGDRCASRSVQLDHLHGLARTARHGVEGLRLLCHSHNQYEAERLYGAGFMRSKRRFKTGEATPPSAG